MIDTGKSFVARSGRDYDCAVDSMTQSGAGWSARLWGVVVILVVAGLRLTPALLAQEYVYSSCTVDTSELLSDPRLTPSERDELRLALMDPATEPQHLLSKLEVRLTPAPTELNRYWRQHDPIPENLRELSRKYNRSREDLRGEFLDALATVLPTKRDEALDSAVYMLTEMQYGRSTPMSQATSRCLKEGIAQVFGRLTFEKQRELLMRPTFKLCASPALGPALSNLYRRIPRGQTELKEGDQRISRKYVLLALHKSDPTRAREIIMEELRSPRPKVDFEALDLLPEPILPELDQLLASQLTEVYENATWDEFLTKIATIERYSSGAVYPQVRKFYLTHLKDWYREPRALLLSYLLRVQPEVGRKLIEDELRTGNDADTLLTDLRRIRSSDALEPIALQVLKSGNDEVAADAASVLGKIGPPEVEPLLWEGLRDWHNRWIGRESEMKYQQIRYRDAVVEALVYGQHWVMSEEKLEEIRRLSWNENSVAASVAYLPRWEHPVRIRVEKSIDGTVIKIWHYGYASAEDAEQQLRLFPRGLEFEYRQFVQPMEDDTLQPIFEKLRDAVIASGSSIHVVQ